MNRLRKEEKKRKESTLEIYVRGCGRVNGGNLWRVRSFNFGELNNYQLFNVLFPLHNSALVGFHSHSSNHPHIHGKSNKSNGAPPRLPPLVQRSFKHTKKRIMDLWIINIFGFLFPSIHSVPAKLPSFSFETTLKKLHVMMLLRAVRASYS